MRRPARERVVDTVAGYSAPDTHAATVTTPPAPAAAPPRPALPRGAGARLGGPAARFPRPLKIAPPAGLDAHRVALFVVLAVAFGLRLWGVKQGLPYSYNSDEAAHFVPRAIAFFGHDYNPQYFLNPPAYAYLVHIVYELWYGSGDAVARAYAADPTGAFVIARIVAAGLGTIAVWLTYLAGARLLDRKVALAGAAAFAVAFLPSFYSHLALNDVPTTAPVALALYGIAGVVKSGSRRDYAVAGLGIGLAAATKYTGAIMFVCLAGAAALDAARAYPARSARRLALAVGLALAAFIVANPFSVLDFSLFHHDIVKQQSLAGGSEPEKLGTTAASGTAFYLWTFTWGLGWVPSLAAVGGSVTLLARRRLALAAVLIPAPIAFIIFMGDQQRFFGRWLMPVFPIVALLAGYGLVELVRWLHRDRRVPLRAAGAVAAIALLAQGLSTTIHDDRVLSRPDTRNTLRDWMVAHVPAGSKVVVEPVVSSAWNTDTDPPDGGPAPTPGGGRWTLWDTYVSDVSNTGAPLAPGQHRYVALDQYERTLRPSLITRYEQSRYCWVVISSLQAGRSFAQPTIAPQAIAYYAALANQGKLVYHLSPFSSSKHAVPFSFDWSIDYYPSQYRLPGPEMSVYRLTGGRCAAGQ